MYIKKDYIKKDFDFSDLKDNSWSDAVSTLMRIEEENKENKLMQLLSEAFHESVPTETEINDFLMFDSEFIFEALDIETKEDMED